MKKQLNLNFAGYDETNDCGVYCDCEALKMPRLKINARAEIRIAFTSAGYLWGCSAMMETQGFGGYPSESDVKFGRYTGSRADAIQMACDDIYRHCHSIKTASANAILKWVEDTRSQAIVGANYTEISYSRKAA